MRILYVHRNLMGEGAESAEARQSIRALLRQGHEVGFLAVAPPRDVLREIEAAQAFWIAPDRRDPRREMAAAIAEFRPEVAHIKSLWTPFHAAAGWVVQQAGIPYLVEPGGHLNAYSLKYRFGGRPMRWYHWLGRQLYYRLIDLPLCRRAAGIRALSPWEERNMHRILGRAPRTIPLGINDEWVTGIRAAAPFPAAGAPLRANYVGRLDIRQKGLDLVLDAAAHLAAGGKGERVRFRLAGPEVSGSRARLQRMIAERGVAALVSLEEGLFGEAKADFFRETDVFLHLSRNEETAKLAREATGAGLPVLASRESNYGDWVESEGSGLAAELTAESIAAQLLRLQADASLVPSMSARAVAHAGKYTWDAVTTPLVAWYREILGRG